MDSGDNKISTEVPLRRAKTLETMPLGPLGAFSRLPFEIRKQIWDYAVAGSLPVVLEVYMDPEEEPAQDFIKVWLPAPGHELEDSVGSGGTKNNPCRGHNATSKELIQTTTKVNSKKAVNVINRPYHRFELRGSFAGVMFASSVLRDELIHAYLWLNGVEINSKLDISREASAWALHPDLCQSVRKLTLSLRAGSLGPRRVLSNEGLWPKVTEVALLFDSDEMQLLYPIWAQWLSDTPLFIAPQSLDDCGIYDMPGITVISTSIGAQRSSMARETSASTIQEVSGVAQSFLETLRAVQQRFAVKNRVVEINIWIQRIPRRDVANGIFEEWLVTGENVVRLIQSGGTPDRGFCTRTDLNMN